MKNITKLWTLLAFCTLIAWCSTPFGEIRTPFDDLAQTPEYQQAKQQITSWVEILWNKTNEYIETHTWAQLIRDAANEKINQVTEEAKKQYNQAKEEAIKQYDHVKEEAKKQYNQAKEDTKASIKDAINKKVDEAFDKI